MKTYRIAFLGLLLILVPLRSGWGASDSRSFLGWIPMQCVPAGGELVLDLHRFYQPAEGETVWLSDVVTDDYHAWAQMDRFELKVRILPEAKGIMEVPLKILDAKNDNHIVHEGVVVIAVQPPGIRPGPDLPSVFAESRNAGGISFHVVLPKDAQRDRVSAIIEQPDGSSRTAKVIDCKSSLVTVPTAGLPDGAWIRVAIADDLGRVSRAVRARVKPTEDFQWQDGIMYYAFTDRFVDGDPANDRPSKDPAVLPQANYQGGDFQGIQKRIDDGYFKKIGVNVLWLAPLNRNPDGAWKEYQPPYRTYTGYHGYWPISRTEIEPRFGGEKGLKDLVGAARKNDIKIIADLVLKHSHVDDPMWKEHRDWYGTLELTDGKKNLRLWDEYQFSTWFEEFLPAFDFDNPKPVAFLIDNARSTAEKFDLNGYRLDAVKHIKYSFWPKFRTAMRRMQHDRDMSPMYFVGETFMNRQGIMSFVGPNMLDGQFDFPLYDTIMDVFGKGQKGFGELEDSLSASETIYGKETLMSPLIGNHDKSRFMAYADGDLPDPSNEDEEEIGWANPPRVDHPESYEKLKLALGFLLSIDGVPMVYYGDEVGLTGAGDPDNRKMMPAESALDAGQKGVRDTFAKLTALRSAHPALRYGSRRLLVADAARYAFVRRHFDDRVLAVWNRGSEPAEFELSVAPELPDGPYADILSGRLIEVKSGVAKLRLDPMRSAFFIPQIHARP